MMCNALFKHVSGKQDEQGMECNRVHDKVTKREKFGSHPNSDTERLRSAGHTMDVLRTIIISDQLSKSSDTSKLTFCPTSLSH